MLIFDDNKAGERPLCLLSFVFSTGDIFVLKCVRACMCACNSVNSDLPLGLADTPPSSHHKARLLNAQMNLFPFLSQSCRDKESTEMYGSTVTKCTHFKMFPQLIILSPGLHRPHNKSVYAEFVHTIIQVQPWTAVHELSVLTVFTYIVACLKEEDIGLKL